MFSILQQDNLSQLPPSYCRFFSSAHIDGLDPKRIPKHVAIIPDGNRRWAHQQEFASSEGHRQGADILMDVVKSGIELGLEAMTFYTFSTENWQRSPAEVEGLMWLLHHYLTDQCQEMIDFGIRLQCIGDLSKLPKDLYQTIQEVKLKTAACTNIDMVLALNYGSRDEICRAIQSMVQDCTDQKLSKEEIKPETVSRYLDTSIWKDPELLIRTSGEMRVSNFLLWQLSYTEIHISDVLWPDFQPRHLYEAIYSYQQRNRRHGGS